jgi:hypothetical protein
MKKSYILLAGLALSAACNDKGLDKVNPNELSVSTYFKTGSDIVAAVNAAYSSLQAQHLYGREYFFLHDTRSDEMQPGGGQLETHRAQLLNGVHRPDNQVLTQVWQGWYRVIHQANVVVDYAPKATQNVTEALKSRVIGEAKFLRGWAYFELVSLWGGVPLLTSVVNAPTQTRARAAEDEVYAQIISDLTDAISALPPRSVYSDDQMHAGPPRPCWLGCTSSGGSTPKPGRRSKPSSVRASTAWPTCPTPTTSGRKTNSTRSRCGKCLFRKPSVISTGTTRAKGRATRSHSGRRNTGPPRGAT